MKRVLLVALLLPTIAFAASKRRTVVISDTHLGVGRCTAALWHPYEDFRWHEDFNNFLLNLRSNTGATDLVLNGDTFELWQSVTNKDCTYKNPDLSCTKDDAVKRLTRIIGAHAPTLASLREFANDRDNRVYIVPGNHDAALLYTAVADLLVKEVGAKPRRVTILPAGHWVSEDGLIVAAHGHQMDETNAYKRWPNVFRTVKKERYLERPWGEQFVQVYYNAIEHKYPLIDNIAGEGESVRYGIAAEGKLRTIGKAGRFAKFFLFSVSGRQLGDVLATPDIEKRTESTEWNIPAIRKAGPIFFAQSVPRDDIARPGIEAGVSDGLFNGALKNLSDGDINAICDERSALADAGVDIERCQAATLTAIVHRLTTDTNERILRYLHQIYNDLPPRPDPPPAFELAIFSHTHAARDSFDAETPDDDWVPSVLNTGAWQRLMDGEYLKALLADRQIKPSQALNSLTHNDLPATYPYVVIEPYDDIPAGKLHHWKGVTLAARKLERCP